MMDIFARLENTKISDKTMSGKKDSETIITNEQTLRRRAWVESALESVRQRLGIARTGSDPESGCSRPRKRHLYVATSNGSRRTSR